MYFCDCVEDIIKTTNAIGDMNRTASLSPMDLSCYIAMCIKHKTTSIILGQDTQNIISSQTDLTASDVSPMIFCYHYLKPREFVYSRRMIPSTTSDV